MRRPVPSCSGAISFHEASLFRCLRRRFRTFADTPRDADEATLLRNESIRLSIASMSRSRSSTHASSCASVASRQSSASGGASVAPDGARGPRSGAGRVGLWSSAMDALRLLEQTKNIIAATRLFTKTLFRKTPAYDSIPLKTKEKILILRLSSRVHGPGRLDRRARPAGRSSSVGGAPGLTPIKRANEPAPLLQRGLWTSAKAQVELRSLVL